jgi:hypothetical protein
MLPESAWYSQKLDVFLDSGANRFALIDEGFAWSLNRPVELLLVPQALYLADKMLARTGPVLFWTTPLFLCFGGHQGLVEAYIEKALARGWISPSESPLGAPCVVHSAYTIVFPQS